MAAAIKRDGEVSIGELDRIVLIYEIICCSGTRPVGKTGVQVLPRKSTGHERWTRVCVQAIAVMVAIPLAILAPQTARASSIAEPSPQDSGTPAAPPAEDVNIAVDGRAEKISSNLPWRMVRDHATKETRLFVGPGVPTAKLSGEVVASWDGPIATKITPRGEAAVVTASGNWYCEGVAVAPQRSGGQLQGWVGVRCYAGPMPTYRMQWQFERHASLLESVTGWKQYSARKFTSWTSSMATGTTVYAHCNTADRRTRAYTTYHRFETTSGYFWSWYRSPASISWLPCGFSEY
jgi:hypothetical protein